MIPAFLLANPLVSGLAAAAIAAGLVAGVQTVRLSWVEAETAACGAARAEDRRLAETARADALEDARKRSDAIIAGQAEALAQTAARAGSIIERIVHVPVTNGCGPVMRDASRGVRELLGRPAGGGAAAAGGDAPPAVPGSGAGR